MCLPCKLATTIQCGLIPEKLPEKGIVRKRIPKWTRAKVDGLRRVNTHHTRRGFFDNGREADAQFDIAIDRRGFDLDVRRYFPAP